MVGLQGRAGGFADPEDVEVNLEGGQQGSAWGEAEEILTYVQSKVGDHVCMNAIVKCQ